MKRELIVTKDGTHTLAIPEQQVMYHSIHGAVQESTHVYIQAGLAYAFSIFPNETLRVFEMGFGSGLNALVTAIETEKLHRAVHYTSVELFPLTSEESSGLNYGSVLDATFLFEQIHQCAWQQAVTLNRYFTLQKEAIDLLSYAADPTFHLIYYDAFAPAAQPELWTQTVFEKLFAMLRPGGCLVTYCAKGSVKRAMKAAGFTVSHLPGPPGKREMLRAVKALPPKAKWVEEPQRY